MKQHRCRHEHFEISLKLLLRDKRGWVLLLKSQPGGLAGPYDLPGGRVDKNEWKKGLRGVIQREIQEEIGRRVRVKLHLQPVGVGKFRSMPKKWIIKGHATIVYILFPAEYLGGKIAISHEHVGYEWKHLTKKNYQTLFNMGLNQALEQYFGHKRK